MRDWSITLLDCSLGPYSKAWDELNTSKFGRHPLLSSTFVDGLLRHFGNGTERLCVMEINGQIEAMCILRPQSKFVWTSFLPSQTQIGPTMVRDAAHLNGLMHCLPFPAVQLDLLCNDPNVGGVVGGHQPGTHRLNHALTMQIRLTGGFEGYWRSRSGKLRNNYQRYQKRLAADRQTPTLVEVTSSEQMTAAVERYAALEGAGWKALSDAAMSSLPNQLSFYTGLMTKLAGHGEAVVYELWLSGRLAASRLLISVNNTLVTLKTTYDESMSQYGIGRVHLKMMIERVFLAYPGATLEFYTDATLEQLSWATEERWIQHHTIFRGPIVGLEVTGYRLAKAIASHICNLPNVENKTVTIESFDQLELLPNDVLELLAKAEQRDVEFGVHWFRNLVNTVYPAHGGIRLYVMRYNQKAVAVVPIRAECCASGWRLESLSNFYTALYEPAFVPNLKSKDLVELLKKIRNDFSGTESFRLAPMNPNSHAYQILLGAFRLDAWLPFEFFAFGNWHLPRPGSWPHYLATRSSIMRNTITRMSKKLESDGGTLQLVTKESDIAAGVSAYEQVYAASWKRPEPFDGFSPGLLQTCARQGWLRLGIAWLRGQPIAAQLWIVANGRAEIYKLAYDEQFKSYSPGTLLSAMLMQHVLDVDKVHEVDYLVGDDPYKQTWMSHRRERWGIVAYNPRTFRGLLGAGREFLGRKIKPLIVRLRSRSTRASD